ncbi:Acetyl-CoA synthetase-like protein [Glarea lozoyensis ATCC 20868]|uniref:Very long-chain fatty acid transport protein n=1 Tax=Glarea lozoyensis (strain ATCC 20868 / MF5171) TaxID=1116229 RepID=S3D3T3_GLAL2|nr:Acetyl-CoA synthetase-like protein [Glarea lozoyensis ATCC 20868]EPE26716.1 Acetyl-CoA synthetase-like protein [Glarea lozoyensis ATCC 20868]
MALVTAAAVAGTTLAGMYLDAKYHVRKDIRELNRGRTVVKMYAEAVRQNRVSLWYFFEQAVNRKPTHEAIWSRTGCYTFAETHIRATQYAHWFLSRGVKPKDYVAFFLTNSPDFLFAWLGLWAIGAAPALINYNLTGKALVHCLKLSGAKLLLVDGDELLKARIEEVRGAIEGELGMDVAVEDADGLREIQSQSRERIEDIYREGVRGDWPMGMLYTSGTTGMPKGVSFTTERQWLAVAAHKAGYTTVQEDDRWYNCMPLYHGTGGITSISMVINGVTTCIGKKFSTSQFWRDIHDSKATYFIYVGETARYLLAAPPSPLDTGHNVRCMHGNGLRPDVWIKFRDRFNVPEVSEFFSSSEGVFGLLNYARGDYFAGAVGHNGLIGRQYYKNIFVPVATDEATGAISRDPVTGFAYRQPYEVGGEIIVQLPDKNSFAGYYNNPEATAKKFERDVFQKGDLWYRTGDALRRTSDGRWFFLDRLGDTFRWKGENVSTAEVAEVLGNYPGVVEANVYGVLLPNHDGRAGCAALYIDPNAHSSFDFAGLLRHTRAHLPKYAVPLFLRLVSEMTPIHNNKQNKVPLREEGVDFEKMKGGDRILWVERRGKGDRYVEFTKRDWEGLRGGGVRL